MANVLERVPVREQDPKVRATNFEEVCYGYNKEEAMEEAQRCINCKNARCIQGCPVSINIPGFISHVKEGNIEEAYKVIGESSALPAICGRVCHRSPSARANVSVESKVTRFQSVNLKDSLLITLLSMTLNLQNLRRQMDIKLQLSVLVRPDLHAPETLQSLVMK